MGGAAGDLEGIDPVVIALAVALAAKRPLHVVDGARGTAGAAAGSGGAAATSLGPAPAKPRSRAPRPKRKG